MDKVYDILIIGAGPSGLSLAHCLPKDKSYVILEASDKVGGIYSHIDPHFELVSPQSLCQLPKLEHHYSGERVNVGELANFMQGYAKGLNIKFNQEVSNVSKSDFFKIKTQTDTFSAKKLVLASGKLQSIKDFSSDNPNTFSYHEFRKNKHKDKNILIVGSGLSACETAMLASENNKVTLALKYQLKTLPMKLLGINLHWPYRPIEKLPRAFFPCSGPFRDPVIDTGIHEYIKAGKVKTIKHDEINVNDYDIIYHATGYRMDFPFLDFDLEKWPNGKVKTTKNESSVKDLFIMGYHCARNFDSKFLRGIKRDAIELGKIL